MDNEKFFSEVLVYLWGEHSIRDAQAKIAFNLMCLQPHDSSGWIVIAKEFEGLLEGHGFQDKFMRQILSFFRTFSHELGIYENSIKLYFIFMRS